MPWSRLRYPPPKTDETTQKVTDVLASQAGLRRKWPFYIALAIVQGAYLGINARLDNPSLPAWQPFVWEYSSAVVIAALIPLVGRLERYFPIDSRPRGRIVAVHALGVLCFTAVHMSVAVALRKLAYALAGGYYDFGDVPVRGFYELQKDAIVYLVIVLVVFANRELQVRRTGELRAVKLAAELGEAQLRQLTAQIEPHFLFNSLNAISNQMREDVDVADRMITHLGDLMRAAYDTNDDVLVPLGSELKWLQDYAAMMVARYEGQLVFDLDVEPSLAALMVPRLLLQPVVENAFRHGLGGGRGRLCVMVRRVGDHLQYTVSDDGVGFSGVPCPGTGLSNVSRRLQLLFAGEHTLSFAERAPRGTVVTIRFPVPA
jgi:signal transduction histidine kinase